MNRNSENERRNPNIIAAFSCLIERLALQTIQMRDNYTYNHCRRVGALCRKFFYFYQKNVTTLNGDIERELLGAASLHDLGKISWSDRMLVGDHIFGEDETKIKETHPEKGAVVLYKAVNIAFSEWGIQFSKEKFRWILGLLHHHRNHSLKEGSYPEEIRDENLKELNAIYSESLSPAYILPDRDPLRVMIGIIRLSDSIDAGRSPRPYPRPPRDKKTQKTWNELLEEVKEGKGSKYHPGIAELFINYIREIETFYQGILTSWPWVER